MTDVILALNAGSSSLKFSLFAAKGAMGAGLQLIHRGAVEGIGTQPSFRVSDASGALLTLDTAAGSPVQSTSPTPSMLSVGAFAPEDALRLVVDWIERYEAGYTLVAAGHRVVHGGTRYTAPVLVDDEILRDLERLSLLAPLHQPYNLAGIRAAAALRPRLPQVACFDTAFHATQAAVTTAFALPRDLAAAGIRRYGFHGLSYEYIASILPTFLGPAADGRVVVAHLGNGASMCAMRERHSVATTTGFTALDGLPMGTRCGALDPGVVLYLLADADHHMDMATLTDLLYRRSGLLGLSGMSGDMRTLLANESPAASHAVDVFIYRIGRELGSLAAALGGLDALVFTAGIGEHAAPVRARVCNDAAWLGIRLDEAANRVDGPRISEADSAVSAWVIPTDEDLMIARHTLALLRCHNERAPRSSVNPRPRLM